MCCDEEKIRDAMRNDGMRSVSDHKVDELSIRIDMRNGQADW